jgi:hypothetical protein
MTASLRNRPPAFPDEAGAKTPPKSLGNQANFVINFCQILFALKSPELQRSAS